MRRLWCRLFGHSALETIGERFFNGHLIWRCPRCGAAGALTEMLDYPKRKK